MSDIQTYLRQILDAVYGEEVRNSIHDAISTMNSDLESAIQDDLNPLAFKGNLGESGGTNNNLNNLVQTDQRGIWRLKGSTTYTNVPSDFDNGKQGYVIMYAFGDSGQTATVAKQEIRYFSDSGANANVSWSRVYLSGEWQPWHKNVDNTLSIEGAAADAKAVGTLKTAIDENNLIKVYPYSYRGIIKADGSYEEHLDLQYRVTDFIPVLGSVTVTGRFGNVVSGYYQIVGYNEDKKFAEDVVRFDNPQYVDVDQSLELDEKVRFIRVMTTADFVNTNGVYSSTNMLHNISDRVKYVEALNEYDWIKLFPFSFAGVINADGSYSDYPTLQYRVTDFIPVAGSVTIIGNFGSIQSGYYHINGYDEEKNFVSGIIRFNNEDTIRQSISLGSNVRYIRLMTTADYTNSMHVFSYSGTINSIINKVDSYGILKDIFEIYFHDESVTCQSVDNFSSVADGYCIAISNKVQKGSFIQSITFKNDITSDTNGHYIVFISNNNAVSEIFQINGKRNNIDYLTPTSGYLAYCRNKSSSVSKPLSYKYNVQSSSGFTSIKNHIFSVASGLNVGDIVSARNYSTETINFVGCDISIYEPNGIDNASPYSDRHFAFLGDSITAGYSVKDGEVIYVSRPYPKVVESIYNCITQNKGYSSYPISSVGKSDCLLAVYTTIYADSEYIIVLAGTNDLYYNVPIGTAEDRSDISFCGAVYSLINGLITNYPNAQIVFMTPIHRSWEGPNQVDAYLVDYVNSIKEVCGMCGVPVIDLYNESYFNYVIDASKAMLSDGLHPTQDGYDHLGKLVAKRLESILMSTI